MVELPAAKPLEWMGNTRRVVQGFAKPVRQVVGQALYPGLFMNKKRMVGQCIKEYQASHEYDK